MISIQNFCGQSTFGFALELKAKSLIRPAVVCAAVAFGFSASPVQADPVIGSVTWNGAKFSVELTSYDAASNTYDFRYVADFSDGLFNGADHTDYLTGINFKPSQGNVTGGALLGFSVDNGTSTTQGWTSNVDSNLSSNPNGNGDCAGKGAGNDFFCAMVDPFGSNYSTSGGHLYTWTFRLTITGVTDPNALVLNSPIRASFTDGPNSRGTYQNTLMSETTSVPEPATLALFGAGVGACLLSRRRNRRRR